ncbi:MAG: SH3 domain-containing protein [Clostridia bacterium]|nr:SH3 domain-containing protein [Clostridia bacterium]
MRFGISFVNKQQARLLALCLLFLFILFRAAAAPAANNEGAVNGTVRVYLSSLGQPSRLDLTVCGDYSLDGTAATALPDGSTLTVNFSAASGALSLTRGGVTTAMGSSFRLRRHAGSQDSGIKIRQARVPGNRYPGDMEFKAVRSGSGYRLYVIAHVFIEDYLYGVLPYEMGNSSALEALKAQCVSARTYTLRAMRSSGGRGYDLVDTTNDQVYNGTSAGNARCRQAVDETRGIVAMNGGDYTATYYTASNGGQIESVRNIWGSSAYDYIRVKDDPFDYQNPYSQVRSFRVAASGKQPSSALNNLLVRKARAVFGGSDVSIAAVHAVTPHTPRYAAPSRLYTKLNFDVTAVCDGMTRQGTLTFDIFSELEGPLSMSINNDRNELWSVVRTDTGFTVQARRFGHGTGMSQRGAMRMGELGYTYDQILDFYFEGCQRVQYTFVRSIWSALGSGVSREELSVDAPAPLDGVTTAVGIVNLIRPNGEMALRKAASPAAPILAGIPHGAAVTVHAQADDWYLVTYGALTGYVQGAGLRLSGTPDGRLPAISQVAAYGTVTGTGHLNLRQQATQTAASLVQIPSGTALPLLRLEGDWAFTQYGCQTGYVSLAFISRSDVYPGTAQDANATGAQVLGESPLYLSSGLGGYRHGTVPAGAVVRVIYDDGAWSQVEYQGVVGYLLSANLRANGMVMQTVADTPGAGEQYALVSLTASTLNMREAASMESTVMLEIPRGETVIVTEAGDDWCRVRYHGVAGYCVTHYLSLGVNGVGSARQTAVVVTESGPLNLRASASVNAAVLTTIPRGQTVPILKEENGWCLVSYNGKTGYAMARFLRQEAMPVATPVPTATPVPQPVIPSFATVTTPEGSLNLRRGADQAADILARIPQNETVPVLALSGAWTQVRYDGKTGYVMSAFLTYGFSEPQAAPPQPEQQLYAKVNTEEGSLNLRKRASSGASILARIPQGELIEVTAPGDRWSQVVYNGKTGYARTAFLSFVEVPRPVQQGAQTAIVTTEKGSLNLRSAARSGAKVLRTIPQGATVTVLEQSGKWARVTFGAETGYVKLEFLTMQEQSFTSGARRLIADAKLYAAPDINASVSADLRAGEYVLALARSGDWCQAEYDGIRGFVPWGCLE